MAATPMTIRKEGDLSKKGLWGQWKTRHFVLQPPFLLEYHSAKHAKYGKSARALLLAELDVCKAEGINGHPFSFALRRRKKEAFFLACDNEQEMVEWVRTLAPHVQHMSDEWVIDDNALEKDVEAVCVTNVHGFFLSANELFCNLTGFSKDEILGKSCTIIMPSSVASKHESYMTAYFNTGVKRLIGKPRKLPVQKKDGSLVMCNLHLGELIDTQKSLHRFVMHLRPVMPIGTSSTEDDISHDELSEIELGIEPRSKKTGMEGHSKVNGHIPKSFSELSDECPSDGEGMDHDMSGFHRHGSNLTSEKPTVPYHPVIDKMGKIFDCKINTFEHSLKKTLQNQMSSVLGRLDLLETELKEAKRALDFHKLQKQAALDVIIDHDNNVLKKLKRAITAEIKNTEDEKILFRMDTKVTKRIISYMIALGGDYLDKVIGPTVRKICEDQLVSYEINARIMDVSEDREHNIDRLKCITTVFTFAVTDSTNLIPTEFCELFQHVKKECQAKWGSKAAYHQPIGSIFFLRFINAAIASPTTFGLLQEVASRPHRGLVLVSKLLQRIVNGLTCEATQELSDFNGYVTSQIPSFVRFIDHSLVKS